MPAIISDLVNMASTPAVSTSDLLRHALVVARRLDASEAVDWINLELNGYAGEIPPYRIFRGQLKCENPVNGLIPLMGLTPAMVDVLSQHAERQSIPELEEIARSEGILMRYFPTESEARLMQKMQFPMRPVLLFSHTQVRGVIEKVRNKILDWALDLERRGVLGEGMAFTPGEKRAVQELHYHFGDVTSSQIQISSPAAHQTQMSSTLDVAALNGLISALDSLLAKHQIPTTAMAEIQAELGTLRAQAASPKPKKPIIRAALQSIKTIIEGAAGNILANLAQPHAATLFSLMI